MEPIGFAKMAESIGGPIEFRVNLAEPEMQVDALIRADRLFAERFHVRQQWIIRGEAAGFGEVGKIVGAVGRQSHCLFQGCTRFTDSAQR